MQNLHINHPLVIDMANNTGLDKWSCVAILTAQESGIKPHEMDTFMECFDYHMANSTLAMYAIEQALIFTIQHYINIDNIVTKNLK
jgi:hypothetical protein